MKFWESRTFWTHAVAFFAGWAAAAYIYAG